MVSGYFQAAAYTNLDGVGDLYSSSTAYSQPQSQYWDILFSQAFQTPRDHSASQNNDVALAKEQMKRANIKRPGPLNLNVFERV